MNCRAPLALCLAVVVIGCQADSASPTSGPPPPEGAVHSEPGRSGTAHSARPNIVWIVADDMGWADAGFQGSDVFQTPHLDELAAEGVRFSAGYTTASVCSPSRAGLLTGQYQQRFGHEHNLQADNPLGLPGDRITVAEHLAQAGYATALVGKWHLGATPGRRPLDQGFDSFYGILGGSRNYFPRTREAPPHQVLMRDHEPQGEPHGGYVTELFGDEAARFVREAPEPFFLLLSFTAPHTPLEARTAQRARFAGLTEERATLAAMTLSMDEATGQVLEALDRRGIARRTLVAFFSDNGGATANHASNQPLRGFKGSKLEGGVRVPFVMRWPARVPGGRVVDEPVSTLDLLPTACAAARAPLQGQDGIDLLPLLEGSIVRLPERALFWRRGDQAALRMGRWKLVRDEGRGRLFDLSLDPGEGLDRATQEPEVLGNLTRRLEAWESELVAPLWTLDRLQRPTLR